MNFKSIAFCIQYTALHNKESLLTSKGVTNLRKEGGKIIIMIRRRRRRRRRRRKRKKPIIE
jgi:hypothetical protein